MKAKLTQSALVVFAMFGLAGCPEESTEETGPPQSSADTTKAETTATAAPTVALTVDNGPGTPGVTPRAKMALDNQAPDGGATGGTFAVKGTKGSFGVPKGWATSQSGDFSIRAAADKKSSFTATSWGEKEDPSSKRDPAAAALQLTDCVWGAPESISLGKDKLPAMVADGTCKHAGVNSPVVYATIAGDDLNVAALGAWEDPGGDQKPVFSIFKSAKKAGGGGDPTGIGACCAALQQNSVNAPLQQKGYYLAALGVCNSLRSNPQGRAALGQVRAALQSANVPAACQ
ncbi:MAG: hypothetical protein JRI68_23700 [Deltaproteobacteria bacterium]|nr:hypothetical protein [Deltaproteobacteria bacterium]